VPFNQTCQTTVSGASTPSWRHINDSDNRSIPACAAAAPERHQTQNPDRTLLLCGTASIDWDSVIADGADNLRGRGIYFAPREATTATVPAIQTHHPACADQFDLFPASMKTQAAHDVWDTADPLGQDTTALINDPLSAAIWTRHERTEP
jgi:hypothetical protein